MTIPSGIRWRQYVIARELVIAGETSLCGRFRHMDLERISTQLKIPRKTLIKISYKLGKQGRLETKSVYTAALIIWAKAVIRRDSQFFTCKPIWIE